MGGCYSTGQQYPGETSLPHSQGHTEGDWSTEPLNSRAKVRVRLPRLGWCSQFFLCCLLKSLRLASVSFRTEFLALMEDLILATDVSRHKDFMSRFEVLTCMLNMYPGTSELPTLIGAFPV